MQNPHQNLFSFLKGRVSILQVVNEHVSLKKAGQYWKGQCPFHNEKTASFTISPHREIFYCFGCHEGGDVISFISKIERCGQLEAAKLLADRYNVELPQDLAAKQTQDSFDDKKNYFSLCEQLAQFLHKELPKHPSVTSYLTKRGFTQQNIDHFKIGYLAGGEKSLKALIREMAKHNFLLKDIFKTCFIEESKGITYSPFEERIIFPIKDHLGRYCGFGGRIIKKNDERSKYYNSRENNYFQKGTLLFGLDSAKKEIQKTKEVFLVEGYTDCMAMVQHGYVNTVATLGTACTLDHLKLLSYHAEKVYLVYDGDTAGQKAMLRLAELCWQVNLELYVIVLPYDQDPADFLQEHKTLDSLINNAPDIFTVFLNAMGQEFTSQSLQQKLEGMRKCIDIIRTLQDPLKQDLLLQKAASIFDLPFSSLKDELKRNILPQAPRKASESIEEKKVILSSMCPLEKKFMCAILNKADLLGKREVIRLIDYLPKELKKIAEGLKAAEGSTEKERFLYFFDSLEYHERQMVNELLVIQEEQESEDDLETLFTFLEKKYWKVIVKETKIKLSQAQQNNNTQAVKEIIGSFLELKKKLLCKGLI